MKPSADTGFLISLKDQQGLSPEGIPLNVYGPTNTRFVSDSKGQVKGAVLPGEYMLEVAPGCYEAIQVLWGGGARLSVFPGQITNGMLSVSWQHRHRPWPPSDASMAPWPVDTEVRLQFYVIDKCNNNEQAPDADYPTFRFESPILRLTRTPILKADGRGIGVVYVACREKGRASLSSVDSRNRSDLVELMEENITTGAPIYCT